jgi:surface protein
MKHLNKYKSPPEDQNTNKQEPNPTPTMSSMPFTDITIRIAVKDWVRDKTKAAQKWGRIEDWDTRQVTTMAYLFWYTRTSFSTDLSQWNSPVTNMSGMFSDAISFPADLSQWDTKNVTNMSYMFYRASWFSADLSRWDTGNVNNMEYMFYGASSFCSDLSQWDTKNVTNMSYMFYGASSFCSDLSRWDTGKVSNMQCMFSGSGVFRTWGIETLRVDETHPYRKSGRVKAMIPFPVHLHRKHSLSVYL